MAKFKGNNSEWVFDSNRNCMLCKFSKGELTTTDEYVIKRLKELGFKEITETKVVETKEPVAPVKSTTKTRTKAK